MAEPVSSSSSSSSSHPSGGGGGGMTIDIRPMIEDVSQVMTKHITNILSGVIGEYTVYKETHDTIMGLPCVRRLQERINELELRDNSCSSSNNKGNIEPNGGGVTREDEIHQLQSAIAELNRYIVALESKVDMKTVCSSSQPLSSDLHHDEEESIRLEIHENETIAQTTEAEAESFVPSSKSKNVIISSSSATDNGENDECQDDEATETTEDLATLVEAEQEQIKEEEAQEAEEEAEDEPADEEGVVEEEEEEAEEDEEAEEAQEEEEEEPAAAEEEAEIEVSEVKIKGKTYFTTDPQNGIIYACVDDDVGDEVGVFKNGVAVFNKGKK